MPASAVEMSRKMRSEKTMIVWRSCVLAAVALGVAALTSAPSFGQETKSDQTAATKKTDAPAPKEQPAAKNDIKASAPSATQPSATAPAAKTDTNPPAAGKAKDAATTKGTAPTAEVLQDKGGASTTVPPIPGKAPTPKDASQPLGKGQPAGASKKGQVAAPEDEADSGARALFVGLLLVALFVVPIFVANRLARMWKMPDHAWKISAVLIASSLSIVICVCAWQKWLGTEFKFGSDLAGGITLIYGLEETPAAANQPFKAPDAQGGGAQLKSGGREFKLDNLIQALRKRIDPSGTKEISIRGYGSSAVEIIIPQVGEAERESVKRRITKMGQLEFRITADPGLPSDRKAIDAAMKVPPSVKDVVVDGVKLAEWVPFDTKAKEFQSDQFVKRLAGDVPEVLVLNDPHNVTGEYLSRTAEGVDEFGEPAVHFSFNPQGAEKFAKLTGQNLPNPVTGKKRNLGVLLDKTLMSAPSINSKISTDGMISGHMDRDQVAEEVKVLNAGSLPATLKKEPLRDDIISPTLGGVTVEHGTRAITASLVAVVIFMIIYYRFSGVVASIGLALNLIMVLALMVLVQGAFTLPGLAGLTLTVGMSVDTNVLIYERIREELSGGAALRMAIRNGFDRAMVAIIDTHLSTIISGIVLFVFGTDQVKGFAVTLILGLIVNLFTAFFCTRVMFDVAERRGFIKELRMMHVFRTPNFDFLSIRWVALGASWVLIIIGMVAVYYRGTQLLDIDFTGGSSVSFALNKPLALNEVRSKLETAPIGKEKLGQKNLLVVSRGKNNTEYTIDTSVQDVDEVKKVIGAVFGDNLKKYAFEYRDLKTVNIADFKGIEAKLLINSAPGYQQESGVSHDALRDQIVKQLEASGHPGIEPTLTSPEYKRGSNTPLKEWTLRIADLDEKQARAMLEPLQAQMKKTALFPLASNISGKVSGDIQLKALEAIGISLVAMVIYLWLRFAKPAYGIAAGVALIHDVLVTIGLLAISEYIVRWIPSVAALLQIDSFQINLTIVAALLTIIGYSVNDTIVTFDRLREIKGKSQNITAKMVNDAVNQTLSRTILTVFTVFIVVVILYFFGGEGVHSFAFAFLVGIVTGTYSSVYIASPVVLWLSGVSAAPGKDFVSVRGMQPAR
jgi:SecD/SecF fusion protein